MKTYSDKEILKMDRKLSSLYTKSRNLGTIELDEPRFMGYQRTFILTEFARLRPDKAAIQRALSLCNTIRYSKDKNNFPASNDDIKLARGRYNIDFQFIKSISKEKLAKCDLDPATKKLFCLDWENTGGLRGTPREVYRIQKPNALFKLKVSKYYITEMPILDSELESEIAQLNNTMERHNLGPRLAHLKGWRKDRWYWNDETRALQIDNARHRDQMMDYLINTYDYDTITD
jgi:hypothetical protein